MPLRILHEVPDGRWAACGRELRAILVVARPHRGIDEQGACSVTCPDSEDLGVGVRARADRTLLLLCCSCAADEQRPRDRLPADRDAAVVRGRAAAVADAAAHQLGQSKEKCATNICRDWRSWRQQARLTQREPIAVECANTVAEVLALASALDVDESAMAAKADAFLVAAVDPSSATPAWPWVARLRKARGGASRAPAPEPAPCPACGPKRRCPCSARLTTGYCGTLLRWGAAATMVVRARTSVAATRPSTLTLQPRQLPSK